jgi:hypothetical protein
VQAELTPDDLVETSPEAPRYTLTRGQETDLPHAAKVLFIDGERDYDQAAAEGRRLAGGAGRVASARLPIVTTYAQARSAAETMVQEAWASRERAGFVLPPSRLALDAADMVTLAAGGRSFPLRLTGLSVGAGIEAEALSIEPQLYGAYAAPVRAPVATAPAVYGTQLAVFMDLPMIRGNETPHAGFVAAFGDPWPGGVAVYRSPATAGYTLKANLTTPASIGITQSDLYSGPTGRWDRGNLLRVSMARGSLASAEEILVLGGANLAAVENADGGWEVIQFAEATLVSPGVYDLSGLLRGQAGTEGAMRDPVEAGARFVLLDAGVGQVDMLPGEIGLPFNWKYGPATYDIGHPAYATKLAFAFRGNGLRPLSPVHVKGQFSSGDLVLNWVRRTRIDGDGWESIEVPLGEESEAYEIDIMNGSTAVRTLATSTPSATYTAAQQAADFGSPQPSYTLRICQLSPIYGRGQVREVVVP